MSDDTAGDGSGFDKEAEREKLREKFARDDEKRESTRRMSELLLKGATMTNTHCDACGSPIFRQNGGEFCPQCDAGGVEAGDAAAGTDAADANAATDATTETSAGRTRPGDAAESPAQDAETPTGGDPAATAPPTNATRSPARPSGANGRGAEGSGGHDPSVGEPSPPRSPTGSSPVDRDASGDDVAAGRDALARALRRHAEAGAEATDPRTAAAHLEAAREAAEALAALRR